MVLFAASWFLRLPDPITPSTMAVTLSMVGFVLALVTGWLGGELVDRLGIGVDEGAKCERGQLAHHAGARAPAGTASLT